MEIMILAVTFAMALVLVPVDTLRFMLDSVSNAVKTMVQKISALFSN